MEITRTISSGLVLAVAVTANACMPKRVPVTIQPSPTDHFIANYTGESGGLKSIEVGKPNANGEIVLYSCKPKPECYDQPHVPGGQVPDCVDYTRCTMWEE